MGRGDRPKVRWRKERQKKKKAAEKRKEQEHGQARKVRKAG